MNPQDPTSRHALKTQALVARIASERSADRELVVARTQAMIRKAHSQLLSADCTVFTGIFHVHDTHERVMEVSARADFVSRFSSTPIDKFPLLSPRLRHLPWSAAQWLRIKLFGRESFCQALCDRAMGKMARLEAQLVTDRKVDAPKGWAIALLHG